MTENNRLPRLDLHCHLDGSLSQGCIEELLGRSVKLEELQADMDCQSLAEYLEKFEIPLECLQTEKGLERAGYDFMKNAALDHVSYIEARFAPLLSTQEGLSTERILEAVLKGMEQGKTEFGIDYGVIVCAMRHESSEKSEGWRCHLRSMQENAAAYRIFWMQCSAVLPEWAMELRFAVRKKQFRFAETDTLGSRCVRSAICRQKR